jgi:hypothetical protein
VATHTEELTSTAVSPNANCITAEVTPENTVNIYQYVPGQLATMCTFEVKSLTGVEGVEFENDGDVEYYNLQGVKIDNPSNGVYIKVQGKTATKVYVK